MGLAEGLESAFADPFAIALPKLNQYDWPSALGFAGPREGMRLAPLLSGCRFAGAGDNPFAFLVQAFESVLEIARKSGLSVGRLPGARAEKDRESGEFAENSPIERA